MKCKRCESERIANVGGKCSDMSWFHVLLEDIEHDGYAPRDCNVGGGDYIQVVFCLDCGQMIGDFPIDTSFLKEG